MKQKFIWLILFLGNASADHIKDGVRVRGITTQYRNTSQPIETTTITEHLSQTTDGSDTGTSTTDSLPPPRTNAIGSDGSHTNTDDITFDITTSSSRASLAHPSGDDDPRTTNCIPSVATYTGLVPDTVYVTTDTSYEVTVTASNVSVSAPTIYETPQSACSTTVMSTNASAPIFNGPLTSSSEAPPTGTSTYWGLGPSPLSILSISQLMLRLTSTVTVTKKTPVQVMQSITIPPVTFKTPLYRTDPASQTPSRASKSGGEGNNMGPGNDTPGPSPETAISSDPTTKFVVAPASPTIAGVAITVGPSSIAIGGQVVTLPTSIPITVVVSSQTFTVNPSEIIGSSTTFQLQNQLAATPTITQAPSVISTAGLVLTVGPTTAVVSGTTYRIGPGAVATILTLNDQTIAIGTDGVVFLGASPTTYAPAVTVAGGYDIITIGSMTIAVDQSDAVISGTTFKIGEGATATTVTFGTETITIGPSGIVLASTTIPPTTVPTVGLSVGSPSTSTSASKSTSSESTDQHNLGIVVQQSDTLRVLSWLLPFLLTCLALL